MNKYFLLITACFLLFACSRRTIPSKSTNATIVTGNNKTPVTTSPSNNNDVTSNNNADSISTADTSSAINNSFSFLVIANGYGKIITGQDALPQDANVHWDALQLSKGFSAQELSNLKARYKTIPPRVLYVNPQDEQQSARGAYYVLGKKFWYWKKKDGLFYLDEKYYL